LAYKKSWKYFIYNWTYWYGYLLHKGTSGSIAKFVTFVSPFWYHHPSVTPSSLWARTTVPRHTWRKLNTFSRFFFSFTFLLWRDRGKEGIKKGELKLCCYVGFLLFKSSVIFLITLWSTPLLPPPPLFSPPAPPTLQSVTDSVDGPKSMIVVRCTVPIFRAFPRNIKQLFSLLSLFKFTAGYLVC